MVRRYSSVRKIFTDFQKQLHGTVSFSPAKFQSAKKGELAMNDVENLKPVDKFVSVDGLKLRYIEAGSGPSVLFLHGASLGSSADVFLRNLGP
ncbi:MAG TPA: hypothetical protein VFD87_16760, partial [Phototrophicaceae bacterium]|nr:hypothetical protein [Phototrophicaceae bacterium]